MVSPAFPALRQAHGDVPRAHVDRRHRCGRSSSSRIGVPRAVVQLRNYEAHRRDQLRERPDADFAVGVKILPDVAEPAAAAGDQERFGARRYARRRRGRGRRRARARPSRRSIRSRKVVDPSAARQHDADRRDRLSRQASCRSCGKVPLDDATAPRHAAAGHVSGCTRTSCCRRKIRTAAASAHVGTLPSERWEAYLTQAARLAKSDR